MLLTPEQLLQQVKELLQSPPERGYPRFVGHSEEDRYTFCTWDCNATEDTPFRGIVRLCVSAQDDMVTSTDSVGTWMRPNTVLLVHHYCGRETRVQFEVKEVYPLPCTRIPSANMVRMIAGLNIKDATSE